MKTKCFCIGCKKHPLHDKRTEFKDWVVLGYCSEPYKEEHEKQGCDVNCFEASSSAEEYLLNFIESFDFELCYYNDGVSYSYFEDRDITIHATCNNEDHED
jgi:hypothetical protein